MDSEKIIELEYEGVVKKIPGTDRYFIEGPVEIKGLGLSKKLENAEFDRNDKVRYKIRIELDKK